LPDFKSTLTLNGTSVATRPTVRAEQTLGNNGEIAVGTDTLIPVTATVNRTGITVEAGSYDGQFIWIVNHSSSRTLTFNATDATSRVAGGGTLQPLTIYQYTWDADFAGSGAGRWAKEAGGGSAMTGAEILAALAPVDGSGSGLDADTLDGSDSTAFATATGLSDHISDTSGAHAASAISYAGGTGMSATDVEAAIDELATEKTDDSALTTHLNDTSDAHDASAISYAGGTGMSATDVEAALDELATEKANTGDAPATHATTHAWGGSDAVRPSVRALQTIGAAGEIAVGTDNTILVTATADRTGITVAAGGFDGHFVHIVNRSAFTLTLNATEATSRVVGGGVFAPSGRSLLVWDANYGGAGVGRWTRLPSDAAATIPSFRSLGTGATQAAAGNDSRLTDARAPTTREWSAVFNYGSTLATQVGVGKFKLPNSGTPTITEVTASVNTLPTGANVIVDVNSVNNTSNARTTLYSTQANRPTISTAGPYSVVATLPNTTQPGQGIEISVDIDQVGSGTAGADLVVIVRGTF
jgi:hypothetical protein